MKRFFKVAIFMAAVGLLSFGAEAQNSYDFIDVSPRGDTLFYTVVDQAANLVSVRGGDSIVYGDTLLLPSTVEHLGVQYTITEVGDTAFWKHNELVFVGLPDSMRIINLAAFCADSSLKNVIMPEGLVTIGESSFAYCTSLKSITIPSTVTSVGQASFYGAFRQLGSAKVVIDNASADIGWGAFYYSNITSIDLGDSVRTIGSYAFSSCYRLDSLVIPPSVTYIGSMACCYNYYGGPRKIRLPEGIDTIRFQAFAGNYYLEEINIPSSVVYIDTAAFWECVRLPEIILPENLCYLGDYAFSDCRNISKMRSLATTPPRAFANTFSNMDCGLALTVPCGSLEAYRSDAGWSYFTDINDDCEAVESPYNNGFSIATCGTTIHVTNGVGEMSLYDLLGRRVAYSPGNSIEAPSSGFYLLCVGNVSPVKVVVP